MGPFIKVVINQGEGVCQNMILLFSKSDDDWVKRFKNDDDFYEQLPCFKISISKILFNK